MSKNDGNITNHEVDASHVEHQHIFILDLDGQITCTLCGVRDVSDTPSIFESQIDFE